MTNTAQITDPKRIEDFIFGGKATFTLKSQKSGKHIAFSVRKGKDGDAFFVRAHQGGVNGEGGFNYAGWLRDRETTVRISKKSHPDLNEARMALDWTLRKITAGEIPQQLEFWHEGRCCKCNRKLTDPASIELGIGPECLKKG